MTSEQAVNEAVAAAQAGPYSRVFTREEDGGYSAEVLEFPGCFSSGDTAEEAMTHLDEAIELWVEATLGQSQEIPSPARNADYSGRLTLRLPPSMHERAAVLAEREGVSLNRYLSTAVSFYTGMIAAEPHAKAGYDLLNDREREVLQLIAEGLSEQAIADERSISVKTVEVITAHIMNNLNARNRTDLLRYAIKHGLVALSSDADMEDEQRSAG